MSLIAKPQYVWWLVPLNFQISKLLKVGSQPISIGAGIRYWAESLDKGPEGFGFRAGFTLLFPTN